MKGFIGNRVRLVAYASAVGLFVFVALLAFPVVETSEEATAATGTALPSTTTLTLSSTNDNAFVNVVPNTTQGTFSASDANGTAGFSVTTNNFTGYTLSISSSDDAGKLENYTHDYIESISSNLTETDFSAASNTSYNNKWGFKPNKYVNNNTVVDNTGSSSVFLPSPTTTPTVLNITSAANTADDNYTIGLGLRADLLLPSGVYSKTLNLIALANVVSYTINFDKNTEDTTVTNMPTAVSGTTSTTGITIPNTTPARANYTFEGWCSVISPTGQCDGTAYQPNGSFGIDQTTENVTTLYAIWMPTRTMQNVYSWMDDLSDGDLIEAHDVRDDKVYSIAKIDGVIWMATNLNLTGGTVLTSADSNVNTNYILPASSLSGFSDNTVAYVFNSSNTECAQDTPCYGYYSFVAASAGTSISQSGGSITYDICPKGWSLPTSEHFSSLVESYPSGGAITASIWKGVYSGRTIDGIFDHGGDMGGYWSSTIKDEYNAYFFSIEETLSKVNSGGSKSRGRAVRCVAKPTMQSVSVDYLEEHLPNAGDTMSLTDARDGKEYPITRIDDNNFWMTSNLDLAGGTTIASTDSNVNTNYTLPISSLTSFDGAYNSDEAACADNQPCYSYYSYAAATAGTNPSSGNAKYDICPKGWRLPTKNEYDFLINFYDTEASLSSSPWNGKYAGFINNGSFFRGGGSSDYWSSTAYNAQSAYRLFFGSSTIQNSEYVKNVGFSVRCIQKASITGVETMQDFAGLNASERQATLDSMKTNIQYEMEDARDGKTYTVAKLPNGSLWMTRNLDLAGGTTLTPATSNVANDYTLPTSSATGFDNNTMAFVYNGNDANSYYSFAATTAGTNPSSGDASYDICPKGWRLPSYNDYTDAVNPSSDSLAGFLNNTLSGRYTQSQHEYNNEYGYYWLSTTSSNNYVRRIIASNGGVFSDSDYRYRGNSVRCMLDNTTIDSITTMQGFANLTPIARRNVLSSMATDEQYTLEDSRDGKTYTIAKLSNGAIWMTKNLDLAGGTALYSDTSNVPDGYPASGGTPYYTLPASSTSGFDTTSADDVYNSNSTTCSNDSPCYSYYNYFAATANTNPSANDAVYDICPKGWRLPVRSEQNSLMSLYSTDADLTNGPWNGVYAGRYTNSTFDNGGLYGRYWSATAYDSSYAYGIGYNNAGVNTNYDGKNRGISVRCVLNTTLQDTTVDMLGDLIPNAGDTVILSDKRDSEKYTIGRLADGNVWMLENLRLGGSATISLTTYDTNIIQNFTLPAGINSGFNSYDSPRINIESKNTTQSYGDGDGRIGIYYNYCAVSAGTVCYDANEENLHDAVYDVCPKGWRMPSGGAVSEYATLFSAYNMNHQLIQSSLRLSDWGAYSNSSVTGRDTYVNIWSSTAATPTMSNRLSGGTGQYNPGGAGYRYVGQVVRCIKSY